MTPPDTPPPDRPSPPPPPVSPDSPTEPSGEEAARLLEVGLSPAEGSSAPPPPAPEEVQPWFPALEILEVLGRGGMGVVYKARQKTLDRIVALKILPESLSHDPAFAERFTREARTLARLQHPHIVGVYEFGDVDGRYYLLMEYVDGVNLRQLMNTQSLTPTEALGIVPQICDALQYAHDQGVVHRDIKPENVMLDRSGNVKVADFGLAKLTDRGPADHTLTGTGQVMGTLHYMAPEQYRTPDDVDHRADIFSLGVVFYEMLTGELPVGRFAKPSEASDLDARLDEIVMKTLERERALRYQQAGELKTEMHTVTSGPPAPPPEFLPVDLPRTQRKSVTGGPESTRRRWSKWALWSLIAIPLAALLGTAVYAFVEEVSSGNAGWRMYYATVAGYWTAGVGFLIAACLATVALILTTVHKGRLKGQMLAVICLVVSLLLIPVTLLVGDQELRRAIHVQRYLRGGPFDEPPPSRLTPYALRHRSSTARVIGVSDPASGRQIRDAVLFQWSQYLRHAREKDLKIEDVGQLYDGKTWNELRALSDDEVSTLTAAHRLGMGLVGKGQLPIPPWELELHTIEVDAWEREATVTARKIMPPPGRFSRPFIGTAQRPWIKVVFPMRRTDGRWVFTKALVTIEVADPDYHPEKDDR